jgi:hypothetical protein
MSEPPIACSLDGEGMAERGREFAALRALSAQRTASGVTLRYRRDAEAAVREFARREKECCPFLGLEVSVDAGGVRLDISGPDDAAAVVEAFLALAE